MTRAILGTKIRAREIIHRLAALDEKYQHGHLLPSISVFSGLGLISTSKFVFLQFLPSIVCPFTILLFVFKKCHMPHRCTFPPQLLLSYIITGG